MKKQFRNMTIDEEGKALVVKDIIAIDNKELSNESS